MGRLDNLPEQNEANNQPEAQTAESLLRSVTQDLRSLQQDLLTQLNQDISRLQAEKSRLLNDIEKLQTQQQTLQSQNEIDLSQRQLAQQQAWAKQLALVLANHLQTALNERLNQSLGAYQGGLPQIGSTSSSEQSYRLAASLDDTVNRTFASLRHDITSYQSSLGQQLERMHTLGQQGEAILEVLVKRLSQQLQNEARNQGSQVNQGNQRSFSDINFLPREVNPPANVTVPLPDSPFSLGSSRSATPPVVPTPSKGATPTPSQATSSAAAPSSWIDSLTRSGSQADVPSSGHPAVFLDPADPALDSSELEPEAAIPSRPARSRRPISLRLGLGLVLLSVIVMSLHYVLVGVVGNVSQLFGQQAIGGYLSLNNFSNSALLLWIRMLVVVPAMVGLATYLHPPTLRDVRAFSRSKDRRTLWGVIGSGIFLFVSQVMLYIAIGQLGPGAAVTTLFIYPVGMLIFSWLLFAEKLTMSRLGIIVAILLGAILALYPLLMAQTAPMGGIVAGILSALTFTCYLIAMQIGARKIHPIPVSLIQFATMFVLSSFSLIVLGIQGQPTDWTQLLITGLVLGGLTIGSYALNYFGIRAIGAARSSIIAASTPTLTALLAFLLVPGGLTTLNLVQMAGILIVTLGGTALSLERMLLQNKAARAKQREQELKVQSD